MGSPKAVHLASVFKFYEVNHGPSIRGLAQAQRPAALCLEFMQKSTDIAITSCGRFHDAETARFHVLASRPRTDREDHQHLSEHD